MLLSGKQRMTVSSQTFGKQIKKPFREQTKTDRYSL